MTIRAILEFDKITHSYAVYCPELPGCTSCGDTEKELAKFQDTLDALETLESEGFIDIVEKHHENLTGHRYTNFVRVRITSAGRRWRKERAGEE